MRDVIYLDYMSTTPVDFRVVQAMQYCLDFQGVFGNPASNTHRFGFEALERIERARSQVAALIGADPQEIIWTSGATESINLALKGASHFYARQGKHLITMRSEHKAVLDTCDYLESIGFEVTYLNPQSNGLINLEDLCKAIRSDTIIASIMQVNNETGVIQDIAGIGEILKKKGILFHVDAAQSVGKLSIDVKTLPVDLMSVSSHKIYGPKGIGALFVRRNPCVRLTAQMHGGNQEWGYRAGTLPTHQIVGMGEAFALAKELLSSESKQITALRDRLWHGIQLLGDIHVNGDFNHLVCGCLNISVDGVNREALLQSLHDLAISTGSACNSTNLEPSHVLIAMGKSRDDANRALRLSVGRFTTETDIDRAIARISEQVTCLRSSLS